jgi:hypothetical protein
VRSQRAEKTSLNATPSWNLASGGQWGKRRARSAGQIPHGKVVANPAAWL